MKHSRQLRLLYARLICLLSLVGSAQAICYSTPRLAVESALVGDASSSTAAISSGYRVIRLESDSVLRQRWATVANCAHPEWPAVAMPIGGDSIPKDTQQRQYEAQQLPTIVHIGDI